MKIDIISLFPEMFAALNYGVVGRAIKNRNLELAYWNPRDFTQDKHRTVDDRPYGGGPGMVMLAQPLFDAIAAAKAKIKPAGPVIHLTPQGQLLTQAAAKKLANHNHLILVSGRYEGVDERLIETCINEEWSIGDYVLSGGELPAMVMIDAIARLLPGVLGHAQSAEQDSFVEGLLDCPHYTRPEKFQDLRVPEVLLSGDHSAIAKWRLKQSLERTWLRRPELLSRRQLTPEEEKVLNAFINERGKHRE